MRGDVKYGMNELQGESNAHYIVTGAIRAQGGVHVGVYEERFFGSVGRHVRRSQSGYDAWQVVVGVWP